MLKIKNLGTENIYLPVVWVAGVVVEPKPPNVLVVPVVPNPVFWVAGDVIEPNIPPVVPVVVVAEAPKPVDNEVFKPVVPNPVEPNGLLADIGDWVFVVAPKIEPVVVAGCVVDALKLNGDVCAGCEVNDVL